MIENDGLEIPRLAHSRVAPIGRIESRAKFLSDMWEAANTPGGTNANRSQEEMKRQLAQELMKMFQGGAGNLQGILGQSAALANGSYNGALNATNSLTGGARAGRVSAFNAGADQNAADANRTGGMFAKSAGLGDGFQAGQGFGFANKAAAAKNQNLQWENDPSKQQADWGAVLQHLSQQQGLGSDYFNKMMGIYGGVLGLPPVQISNNGFGDIFGQAAGAYASGYGGAAGKKAGGGK